MPQRTGVHRCALSSESNEPEPSDRGGLRLIELVVTPKMRERSCGTPLPWQVRALIGSDESTVCRTSTEGTPPVRLNRGGELLERPRRAHRAR